ncbi:beta-galactosidase [Cellulomonas sp. IC4_254]|uniref:beta-galactosidase n=1 Tax=Cellulomonas sp. IC4_254 TaxID=2714040 RepID=UPI0014216C5C|nr:beta-galactosidase [Cellulomonas sp. IC4_254]NHT18716.1 beta-galactosidase [Cellulomonas sp. IC4_254]
MTAQPTSAHPDTPWVLGLDGIAYGGDYNPEQWPEEVWADDVRLMREAGVNLVSVGIFSWALLEPEEGVFDFGWLDRVIDLLHANGIRVDLGTPTASPPAWFFATYPHTRVVDRAGTVLGFGSRGMANPSSPEYRAAAVRITTELAKRYGAHPAIALWHVHNEYGAPVSEDYSATSAAAFRTWLQARYGTLDALNAAWGTAFWGQRYGTWEHVDVPRLTPSVTNPAQRLDFARFTDHALRECFVAEREAIRAHSTIPVTTNFMAAECPAVDLWKWADEVDIVSDDHYLTAEDHRSHVGLALAADLTRSVARGKPWLLMEHSTSAVNWQPRNLAKRPGEMARNSLTHLGRGADGILFFQWRAGRRGAEKFHSAMLPHAGTGSRVFREVVQLGADLRKLAPVRGSRVRADVAILWDWESFWAQDLEWRPSVDLGHRERIRAYYDRIWQDGLTVDFAHPEADLSGYRLVVAPASYLLTEEAGRNLDGYVAGGGTLVVGAFSGVVDQDDAVPAGGFAAFLRPALGVTVEEHAPLRAGERVEVAWTGPLAGTAATPAAVWTEDVTLHGADVVATYVDGPLPGGPAVTRHAHGDGTGWYVSTCPSVDGLAPLLAAVYADAGLAPAGLPAELEVVRRHGAMADYLVAVNHGAEAAELPATGTDLLTGEAFAGTAKVPGGQVRVIEVAH